MVSSGLVVDSAYVISDLHLGGVAPRQMFGETDALAGFIDGLPAGRCALVINGDFVDFLAEPPSRHFDPEGAVAKLQRIAADPAFAPVFAALTRFLSAPGHRLAIAIGNHDLELSLPWVREALQALLTQGADDRAGRLIWDLDGEGVLLNISTSKGASVLCVHGNEVDAWNVADYEALRRIGRDGLRGTLQERYIPNAGSRMVVELMNDIKQRYPFVDLLKPETEAVGPILALIEPGRAKLLDEFLAVALRQQRDKIRIGLGLLGAETAVDVEMIEPLPSVPVRRQAGVRSDVGMHLLDRAEQDLREDRHPLDVLDPGSRTDTLGWWRGAWNYATTLDPIEALRGKLAELADDRSFSSLQRDGTFADMDKRVSTNINFLVTGHTHLARGIEREAGRAWYFNTGTWARVFRIDPAVLADRQRFATLFEGLKTESMAALDGMAGLVKVRPHVARFWHDEAGTHGALCSVDAQAPYALSEIQRYTVS